MKASDTAGCIFRQVEESAILLKSDVLQDGSYCRECRHATFTVATSDTPATVDCNTDNPLECPYVFEVVGTLTDYLNVALQEINFD